MKQRISPGRWVLPKLGISRKNICYHLNVPLKAATCSHSVYSDVRYRFSYRARSQGAVILAPFSCWITGRFEQKTSSFFVKCQVKKYDFIIAEVFPKPPLSAEINLVLLVFVFFFLSWTPVTGRKYKSLMLFCGNEWKVHLFYNIYFYIRNIFILIKPK